MVQVHAELFLLISVTVYLERPFKTPVDIPGVELVGISTHKSNEKYRMSVAIELEGAKNST